MQLRFLNNKGYLGIAKVPPKAAVFSAAGGMDEDEWMDGDTDATGAGELFANHSFFSPLTGIHFFKELAPDFVGSPIWPPFRSDQIKMREKFVFAIPDIILYVFVFGDWHTVFVRKLSLKWYVH